MITILVITGKSCSGKDSIAKELEKLGMTRIVTYTTRPMRLGETEGVEYHYISDSQFKKLIIDGFFAEWYAYKVADGSVWYYGSAKKDYIGNKFIILTPNGLRTINEKDLPITSFYINASDMTIMERMSRRGDASKEAERRFESDKKDFKNIEHLVDFTISNDGALTLKEIAKMIQLAAIGKELN